MKIDDVLNNFLTDVYADGLKQFIEGKSKEYKARAGIFTVNFRSENGWNSVWISVRTSSWDFDNDRSDLHDLISNLLSLVLRGFGDISSNQTVLQNGFTEIPSEIYAKYISFQRQNLYYFKMNDIKINEIDRIIKSAFLVNFILAEGMKLFPGSGLNKNFHKAEEDLGESWAKKIMKKLNEEDSFNVNYMARDNPSWKWYYSINIGVSVFLMSETIIDIIKGYVKLNHCNTVEGPASKIFIYSSFKNAIELNRVELAYSLLNINEESGSSTVEIITEDSYYLIGNRTIICLRGNYGSEKVHNEILRIKSRQQLENELLFEPISFSWSKKINSDCFELLVREILIHEEGVKAVRKVGAGNEPDGGRDLVVEWALPNKSPFKATDQSPYSIASIIIQCKAYQKSVGKDRVLDIRDTLDMHDSAGYLLAVSSNITRPLFDYLKKLKDKGDFYIDWWTRHEIEDRLRKHPHIIQQYSDIVRVEK